MLHVYLSPQNQTAKVLVLGRCNRTKKQITWFHGSIVLVVALTSCLVLAGCANIAESIVYGTIVNSRLPRAAA
jgi:hypothetical protein